MAAENGGPESPVRGKAKKKSALTKLVERKKRVGVSDVDSEYGSRVSLQGGGSSAPKSTVPLEPKVIVENKRSSVSNCVPCKSASAQELGESRPQPRPRGNSKTVPVVKRENDDIVEDVKNGQGQDDSCGDPPGSNRSGPTDSTIYRFRNMRMAAEQPENMDGKLQGPFVPKPPSTPRTPRTAVVKGEKRNHEPTSSGDEPEVGPKRHTESSSDVQNVPKESSQQNRASRGEPRAGHRLSPKASASPAKSSVDGREGEDPANETMEQLHKQYQRLMEVDSAKGSTASVRHNSLGSHALESSFSTPRSGKLAPIQPRHPPPPMEADVTSPALRTAYKADPTYRPEGSGSVLGRLNKRLSDGGPVGQNGSQPRLGSDNMSFTSTSVMPVITTKEARSRSYLEGSVSSGSMSILGIEELERYFPDRRIHIYVGSWNMNELKSLSVSLNDFVLPETCEYVQDMYVIGTQENELNRKEWEVQLQETLGPSHVLFHSVAFGSLHLAIYVRRDLIWFCSVPEDNVMSLRAMSMVKTKGAIGICFSMFGTSFLFINCHLTSDRGSSKNKHRLLDYHRVIRELQLPRIVPDKNVHPAIKLPDVTARFDTVFWCGDLNFRLERRRNAVEGKVTQMTDSDDIPHFEELLGADQLSKYITEGKIFEGFQEGRINFQPTFKFDINTDKYDTSSKMRIPSYTDRVLWRTRKKNQVSCLHYDAVMKIKASDHRAVYAFFEAVLRPGRDNIQLCAGQFDRDVYLEANKRRAQSQGTKGHKHSSVCAVQ